MESNSKQSADPSPKIFAVIKEEQKEVVKKLDVTQTLGSHVLELNDALNLKTTYNAASTVDQQRN